MGFILKNFYMHTYVKISFWGYIPAKIFHDFPFPGKEKIMTICNLDEAKKNFFDIYVHIKIFKNKALNSNFSKIFSKKFFSLKF